MARPRLTSAAVTANREELFDHALALYERGGAEAMSFRALAAEADCSHAKPYSYFDNKADLIDHLRIRAYEWMRDVIAVAASAAPDPLAALQDLASAYVTAAIDRPRMYELLYTDSGAMSETAKPLLEAKLECIGVCEHVIEAVGEQTNVTLTVDASTAAHLFWSAAHGLVSLHNDGFLIVGRSIDDLLPHLFGAVTEGLISRNVK